MNLGASGLGKLIRRDMRSIVDSGSLNTMELVMITDQPLTQNFDPLMEGTYPETVPVSGTLKGLAHFVQPTKSGYRMFTEIKVGDLIIDLPHDVNLAGNPRFLCDGNTYVQKDVGKELTEYWDLVIGGQRMMRTVVLTLRK